MAIQLVKMFYVLLLLLPAISAECPYKKKLIIDVNTSGMGNRMFAIISGAVMAIYLNREFEVNWVNSESCQASYTDLFLLNENVEVFTRTKESVPQMECRIRLSQYKKFLHFWLLIDDGLLTKLDRECDIIYAVSNQWFAPIFYPRKILAEGDSLTVIQRYPSPFKSFMKCLFVPNSDVLADVGGLIEKFQGIKWLSIHARGYFDGGKGTSKTLQCAQRLLEKNIVQQILFVTDSVQLEELARSTISPKYMNSIEKAQIPTDIFKYNRTIEGHYIRDAMETALAEWFLIGEADYCMSPTFWTSTFTRSSMSRGKCKYINPYDNDCGDHGEIKTSPKVLEVDQKIKAMVMGNVTITDDDRLAIWNDIEKKMVVVNPVCTGPSKNGSVVLKYDAMKCI